MVRILQEDNFFALFLSSSFRSGDSSLGFRDGISFRLDSTKTQPLKLWPRKCQNVTIKLLTTRQQLKIIKNLCMKTDTMPVLHVLSLVFLIIENCCFLYEVIFFFTEQEKCM